MTSTHIQKILDQLPKSPGIYKMKNEEGRILYVGKAKNLRNRVRSYFQKSKDHSIRTKKMVSQISDIEFIVVDSELEALILETNLIKELRPKYNILMKDDKSYVYIKVTTNEDFPRITIVRQIEKDKAKYFGPKTSGQRAQQTLKALKKIFPYRHCNLNIDYVPNAKYDPENKQSFKKRVRCTNVNINIPCLDYHIKRCIGPCVGIPTPEEYKLIIDQVVRFLEGKTDEVIDRLKTEMTNAAQDKKFELAARIRDKLLIVESITEKQKISDPNQKNTDIINFVTADYKAYFNLFLIRDGKLIDQETFIIDLPKNEDEKFLDDDETYHQEILANFLQQYYEKAADIGKEILIPHEIAEQSVLEAFLTQIKGSVVKIIIPQKGKKNKLLELARKNAQLYAQRHQISWQKDKVPPTELLQQLKEYLKMEKTPQRIECYDISHFGGKNTVASMVVFENSRPKSKDYRQFRIQTVPSGKPDDYLSLEETLARRLQYLSSKNTLPDGISFGKAKKKETNEVLEILESEKLDQENYDHTSCYVLRTELDLDKDAKKKKPIEKIIGFVRIKKYGSEEKPVEEISSLWINQDYRKQNLGLVLVKMALKKAKTHRVYLSAKPEMEEYFTNIGFRIIYKVPTELAEEKNNICKQLGCEPTFMVFDKKKGTDHSFKKKPDLILIDGGKGQLNAVYKIIEKLQLQKTINLASIAKREEEIFVPGIKTPLPLEKETPASRLLQQCRNEAHRFANEYRKKLQSKDMKRSILDEIEGIGPKTRQELLKTFGSINGIKAAAIEEIEKICGPKLTKKVLEKLNQQISS